MVIEDKYILFEWEDVQSENFLTILQESLKQSGLNNCIIRASNAKGDEEGLALSLEKTFEPSNGLAVLIGNSRLMKSNWMKQCQYVTALPSEHEGIEAVLMNILENELLGN